MNNSPSYDENIIVCIKYNNELNWYVANKLLWIMDLEKLPKIECTEYFENEELKEIRDEINILSENNIDLFLNRIEDYKLNMDKIRLKILEKIKKNGEGEKLEEFYPALMLDFDNKVLYSQFSEPFGFENYVPDTWKGKYENFIDYINDTNKYWIYKNRNLLV